MKRSASSRWPVTPATYRTANEPCHDGRGLLGGRSKARVILKWTVSSSDGSPRLVTGYPAAGSRPGHVDGVCLVGALVRAESRLPDSRSDVGRAVDAVYDALWASRGQPGASLPGELTPVPPPEVRLARVRTLTQWNDRAERTGAEVLAVVDRAISATIMDLMAAPRPQHQPGLVPGG